MYVHVFLDMRRPLASLICWSCQDYMPSTGEYQSQEVGVDELGSRAGQGIGDFLDSI
jgi:hypothetical protein